MKWDTDKIIGTGLIAALLFKIGGDIAVTLIIGSPPNSDLATNIVACLAGYMGRSLAEKLKEGKNNEGNKQKTADRESAQSDSSNLP